MANLKISDQNHDHTLGDFDVICRHCNGTNVLVQVTADMNSTEFKIICKTCQNHAYLRSFK